MEKRDIFVFCGQSNMMGASVLPPKHPLTIRNSLEFKFRDSYIGIGNAHFQPVGYDSGEFLYRDLKKAYPDPHKKCELVNYRENAFFIPSMAQLDMQFSEISESNYTHGACMIPYFCENYEAYGENPLVAHIAKGGVSIAHYFNAQMQTEYQERRTRDFKDMEIGEMELGASRVFAEKVTSMFDLANRQFPGRIGKAIFVWLQGESDAKDSQEEYRLKLEILWKYAKSLGFDYFFCIRVGYWTDPHILHVIRAQEAFCKEHDDCFMVSRSVSYMPDCTVPYPEDWFLHAPEEKYLGCRDTYIETCRQKQNFHINEKGFLIIGKELAQNAYRILREGKPPVCAEECVAGIDQ